MILGPSEDRQHAWKYFGGWKIKQAEIVVLVPIDPSFIPSPLQI